MATLYFKIGADWDNVVRLRNEITKLENQLKSFGKSTPEQEIRAVETRLGSARQEFTQLTTEAAKAGAVIDNDFKKKIFDASQKVNGLTEKIIAQKNVIKETEADVRRLGDAYRNAKKNNPWGADAHLAEYNAARKALEEDKAALFALTQERATAQLSVKKLRDEYALMKVDVADSTEVLDLMTKKLKSWSATILGGMGFKELVGRMIQVRGEFQAADTAIQTLLGSKEKADALMSQVREYAKISPLEFSDVTRATQMMLGFNIEAEKVPRFLQAIGDVSMGDTQKFNSLTLAFSQMSAAGKLMGQDLNQMINAGFNPLQIMSEKTGKSIAQLKEEMSKGAVSAEMVQQAFIDATSAGGKFYQMSENASKTINGQLSMMQDAMDAAFNEMGQKSEGFIMTGIEMTTKLIENYETVGKVLAGLVITYGAYKAALIANIALTRSWAVAARTDAVAKGIQTAATKAQTVAQLALNAAMKANPYALVAAAIVGLTYSIYKVASAESAEEYAVRKTNEAWDEYMKKQKERQNNIESLVRTIQSETASEFQKAEAYSKLSQIVPQLTEKYDQAAIASKDFGDAQKEVSELLENERYEELGKKVEDYKNKIAEAKKELAELSDGGSEASMKQGLEIRIKNFKTQLDVVLGKLAEMDILRQKIAEESKPIEIRIEEAKENEAVRQSIFDFYDKAMLLTKQFQDGNEEINYETGQSRLDEFIQNAQIELEDLRKRQKENPMDLNLRLEEAEKTKILNSVIAMKNNWYGSGATTVWLSFMADYGSAQRALGDAKNHVKLLAGNGGGETYGSAYSTAQKNYETKRKRLIDIKKNRNKYSLAAYNEAVREEADARKTFQNLGGDVSGRAAKAAAATARRQKHTAETAANKRKKRLDAAKRANEELLSLRRENQEDDLALDEETTEKKIKEIELSYSKQIDVIKKKKEELVENNKKAATKGLNANGLTDAQQIEINKATELAGKKRKKAMQEVYDAEIQSMRDYLKEYGSFQQQKLAIAEEYDEKIEKALTEGDKKKLKKEKEKALSGLSFENISMGIDWSALLGGVANLSTEMLKPMLGQLEAYTKTQEFNDADIQEREKVVELIKELRQYVGTDQNTTWKDLAAAITNFTAAVAAYKEAEKNEKVAVAARDEAKGKYERGEISKEEFDKFDKAAQELGEKTVAARDEMKGLGNTLNETTEDLKTQGNKLQSAINKAATTWEGVEGFSELKGSAEGFSQLKGTLDTSLATMKSGLGKDIGVGVSDALGGITDGLTSAFDFMSNGVMGVVGIVAQIPKLILNMADNIKNFVTGILDSFTELLKFEWIEDLVNSILDSVGNLIDAIFDLPENLFHVLESIVVNGVGGLVNGVLGRVGNVLSFGALSSKGPAEWFSGSNAEEVAKTINRLTERNESLQKAIEDLTDEISNSTGAEAISASKQAIEYQKEYNRNILGKAQAQMDYSGNHHSWGYYFGGFSPELVDWIKKNVKQNYNNNNQENELLNLTPEEMKKLLSNVDIRDYIEDTGKSYYGESVLEFLDEYAEQAGKVQDIIDSLNESLTQVSFDSLRDSFVDSLMDMDKSAQDFADDFSEYMMRAVLNARVDEMLGDELQAFYDKWAEYSTDKSGENYELTEDEINKLQKDWDNIVQRGVDLRDQVAAITGYGSKKTTEQSATAKGIESITADQADQLIGRVTAVQIGVENGNTKREQEVATVNILNANLAQLVAVNKEQINRFDGISDILAQSYLVQQDIRDNTGNAAKALRTMQGDLSDIKNEIRRL